MSWSTGPARLPCCSAPRVFVARKRRQASSSRTRDGERNRQLLLQHAGLPSAARAGRARQSEGRLEPIEAAGSRGSPRNGPGSNLSPQSDRCREVAARQGGQRQRGQRLGGPVEGASAAGAVAGLRAVAAFERGAGVAPVAARGPFYRQCCRARGTDGYDQLVIRDSSSRSATAAAPDRTTPTSATGPGSLCRRPGRGRLLSSRAPCRPSNRPPCSSADSAMPRSLNPSAWCTTSIRTRT